MSCLGRFLGGGKGAFFCLFFGYVIFFCGVKGLYFGFSFVLVYFVRFYFVIVMFWISYLGIFLGIKGEFILRWIYLVLEIYDVLCIFYIFRRRGGFKYEW